MTDPYKLDAEAEFFTFTLGGHEYKMRYPTTEEVEAAQKDYNPEKDVSKISKWMYSFIDPVSKDAPDFKDAINKSSIKVLSRFNQMIETEFMGGNKN